MMTAWRSREGRQVAPPCPTMDRCAIFSKHSLLHPNPLFPTILHSEARSTTRRAMQCNATQESASIALPPVDIEINPFNIKEVWEVVDANYLDARSRGFEREAWRALRDEMMARDYTSMRSVHRAVREMLYRGVGDTYTRFLAPTELDTMRKYDITGVGLNLGTADECRRRTDLKLPGATGREGEPGVWVLGLLRGGAADIAGIRQGDKLLEVDGVVVDQQSPFQVAAMIRGEAAQQASTSPPKEAPPQPVAIKVLRVDRSMTTVIVTRSAPQLPTPVDYRLERRDGVQVGYVRLSSFNARAQPDVAAALQSLRDRGAQAFVLDLRDNRGGLVNQGVEVAKLFLDSDAIIVQQLGARAATYQRVTSATPDVAHTPLSAPLTVLVNESTASASEILAGALHDNCRAVLVGKRTFGKGLIQSVYELSDSSGLVLTVGKYVTPNGTDIDREGIQPDFQRVPRQADADRALDACRVARQGGT